MKKMKKKRAGQRKEIREWERERKIKKERLIVQ
jgi:hypothetical protein